MKQDKLVTSYYGAYNFVKENQFKILIGFAAVALVIVAVVLISNKKSSDNVAAAGQLSKVLPLFEGAMYQDAIEGQKTSNIPGLKEIVDNYGSTEYGETAKIYLAQAYSLTNKLEEAFETYDSYSGSNPLFESTALAGKASYFENKQEFAKAADLYKKAAKISVSNPSNAEYLLKAGTNLLKLDKKEEAKSLFEEIKKDYKFSPVMQEIDKYIIQVEN
jgi:tetratricopeptide (TPR) repeat protein